MCLVTRILPNWINCSSYHRAKHNQSGFCTNVKTACRKSEYREPNSAENNIGHRHNHQKSDKIGWVLPI